MIINEINVTQLEIRDAKALDPIRVVMEDSSPGKGMVTISCYGQAWSTFWGAMGNNTVADFVRKMDAGYIAGKLSGAPVAGGAKAQRVADAYLLRIVEAVQEALKLRAMPKEA